MINNQIYTQYLEKLKLLSLDEKIFIVEELWNNILSTNEEILLTDEQRKELIQRLNSYHNNSEAGREWLLVKEEVKSKL